MNWLVFLSIVTLASATISKRPYYRSSSEENDEREETMQFIAKKRDRVSKIDWDKFDPSAVKNRGPARGARISALIDRLDANVLPPSNTIGPYETKSENDAKPTKKSFGHGFGSNYQSPVKPTILKPTIPKPTIPKKNMNSDSDAASSTSKYQTKDSYGSPKVSSKYPTMSLEITYGSPRGGRSEESDTGTPTSKYQPRRSGYSSYDDDSDDESSVVRPPTPTSKMNARTREPSSKAPTSKHQTKRSGYRSYEDDSDDESSVVRPPSPTSKLNMRSQETSVKSSNSQYQAKKYGSHRDDSDDERPIVRPPAQMSKINVKTQESSSKTSTSKHQSRDSGYDSYGAADSNYRSPAVKSSTEDSEHVATPPAFSKTSMPTYQPKSSGYNSFVAAPKQVSSTMKTPVPESTVHDTSPAAFSRPSTPSYQGTSPASSHVNNAGQQNEINRKTSSEEKPVDSATKFQATRSFWSNTPAKVQEPLITNIKLPSSSPKIPVPLVPIRNTGAMPSLGSFAVASQTTPNSEVNPPAVEKSTSPVDSPPPSWMDTAKFMSNARRTTKNMAQQMKLNHGTSDESIAENMKTSQVTSHESQRKMDDYSTGGTVLEKAGIYQRAKPSTFKPSFYTFPRIPK